MFCYKCGNQLREGAGFCDKCGASAVVDAGQVRGAESAYRQTKPATVVESNQVRRESGARRQTRAIAKRPSASGKKKVLVPVIAVVCVVLVVVGFFLYSKLNGEEGEAVIAPPPGGQVGEADSSELTPNYTVIVPPGKYDWIGEFSDGLAVVNVGGVWEEGFQSYYNWPYGGAWGAIDTDGREIIPLSDKYHWIGSFSDGFATISDADGNRGVIDATGQEVIPLSDRYNWISSFSDGMATAEYTDGSRGVIDTNGREVIPFGRYRGIFYASDGFFHVVVGDGDFTNDRYGFIDASGREIIPPIYTRIGWSSYDGFYDGVAIVYNGEWSAGIIDTSGEVIVPLGTYNSIYRFSDGVAIVTGRGAVEEGHGLVGGESGVIDTGGRVIVPLGMYSSIRGFSDGVAIVEDRAGNLGAIDSSGREIIPLNNKYDWIEPFSDGVAVVRVGDWQSGEFELGVIDKSGHEIIPLSDKYSSISSFSDGVAVVIGNMEWDGEIIIRFDSGVIDKAGREIVPLGKYSSIGVTPDGTGLDFSDGMTLISVGSVFENYTLFRIGGEWGIIDATGREIVPPQYAWIEPFSYGVARVNVGGVFGTNGTVYPGGEWGVIAYANHDLHREILPDPNLNTDEQNGETRTENVATPIPALAIDATYLARSALSYGQLSELLEGLQTEFTHYSRYVAWIPETDIWYNFQGDDWMASDDDRCLFVQAPLGTFIPGMTNEIISLSDFLADFVLAQSDVVASVESGAGTAYYIADRYAQVSFTGIDGFGQRYDGLLIIAPLDIDDYLADMDTRIFSGYSTAWLSITSSHNSWPDDVALG